MNKINNRFLIIVFIVLVVLFVYFVSGTITDGGMNGMMNENGWMGSNSWGPFPAVFTLVLVVLIGWLLFRNKK